MITKSIKAHNSPSDMLVSELNRIEEAGGDILFVVPSRLMEGLVVSYKIIWK